MGEGPQPPHEDRGSGFCSHSALTNEAEGQERVGLGLEEQKDEGLLQHNGGTGDGTAAQCRPDRPAREGVTVAATLPPRHHRRSWF